MPRLIQISFQKYLLAIIIALLLGSCKSSKSIIASGEASPKLSAKEAIKAHTKNTVTFKTLKAKIKVKIAQNEKEQSVGFNLRMQKDKVIWLSESILSMVRLKITPEKVQFYNKLDNTYFDGDYSLLSDFVGFELDFFKVQNILLGQAIYNLKTQPHSIAIQDNSYVLQPKKQNAILELFYLLNPSHFKLNSLQLAQQAKRRILQIDYTSYQEVDKQIMPKAISIIAVEDTEQVLIDLEMKSISLNNELRFPFKIPSGYSEIAIK